jgi:hypothetical protein
MKASDSNEGQSASERIDKIVADLGDWRGETFETGRRSTRLRSRRSSVPRSPSIRPAERQRPSEREPDS